MMKIFNLFSLLSYFYGPGLSVPLSEKQEQAAHITNLHGLREPFLLDSACISFLYPSLEKDGLILNYKDPSSPVLEYQNKNWRVINPCMPDALKKNVQKDNAGNFRAPDTSICFINSADNLKEEIPSFPGKKHFSMPPREVLGRYKQYLKSGIFELFRLGQLINKEPDFYRFFFHFFHWHGLMTAPFEKILQGRISIEKQQILKEISQLFSVSIESDNACQYIKFIIPRQLSSLSLRFYYPRRLKTSPYPFLLDKNYKPISFHLRLINNILLEPAGKERLWNHYEIITSGRLRDTAYFGFSPQPSPKSLPVPYKRRKRETHIDTGELSWTVDQNFPSLTGYQNKQEVLHIGPLCWRSCKELHDQEQKLYFLSHTRLRVLQNKENRFLKSWKLCQTARIPVQKVHREHLKNTSPVRMSFYHSWKWHISQDTKSALYHFSFENRLLNGFLGLFLGGKDFHFPENSVRWNNDSGTYLLTNGFSLSLDNNRSLFFEFPFPAVLQKTRYKKNSGWLFPLLQSAEIIDWRWTGHNKTLLQPRIFLPGNDGGKNFSYSFIVYIAAKRKEAHIWDHYTWDLPEPWLWDKR